MTFNPPVPHALTAAKFGLQHLFRRGARGTFYLRRRIPRDLVDTYRRGGRRPSADGRNLGRAEICRSLRTSDPGIALTRLHAEMARIEAEFERRRSRLTSVPGMPPMQRLSTLSDVLLGSLASSWTASLLHCDEQQRRGGLDEPAFEAMGEELSSLRAELGRLLARGNVDPILPAFKTLLSLHRFDAALDTEAERDGAYRLLRTVVSGLDQRLQRQAGVDVPSSLAARLVDRLSLPTPFAIGGMRASPLDSLGCR